MIQGRHGRRPLHPSTPLLPPLAGWVNPNGLGRDRPTEDRRQFQHLSLSVLPRRPLLLPDQLPGHLLPHSVITGSAVFLSGKHWKVGIPGGGGGPLNVAAPVPRTRCSILQQVGSGWECWPPPTASQPGERLPWQRSLCVRSPGLTS